MTPEEQRICIAEACGAKWISAHKPTESGDVPTEQKVLTFHTQYHRSLAESMMPLQIVGRDVPDYLNDLNAMHEAEKVLTNMQRRYYAEQLVKVHPLQYDPVNASEDGYMKLFLIANCTAAQRAEAFLRTIGRWKD